jgi:hypothetical protein
VPHSHVGLAAREREQHELSSRGGAPFWSRRASASGDAAAGLARRLQRSVGNGTTAALLTRAGGHPDNEQTLQRLKRLDSFTYAKADVRQRVAGSVIAELRKKNPDGAMDAIATGFNVPKPKAEALKQYLFRLALEAGEKKLADKAPKEAFTATAILHQSGGRLVCARSADNASVDYVILDTKSTKSLPVDLKVFHPELIADDQATRTREQGVMLERLTTKAGGGITLIIDVGLMPSQTPTQTQRLEDLHKLIKKTVNMDNVVVIDGAGRNLSFVPADWVGTIAGVITAKGVIETKGTEQDKETKQVLQLAATSTASQLPVQRVVPLPTAAEEVILGAMTRYMADRRTRIEPLNGAARAGALAALGRDLDAVQSVITASGVVANQQTDIQHFINHDDLNGNVGSRPRLRTLIFTDPATKFVNTPRLADHLQPLLNATWAIHEALSSNLAVTTQGSGDVGMNYRAAAVQPQAYTANIGNPPTLAGIIAAVGAPTQMNLVSGGTSRLSWRRPDMSEIAVDIPGGGNETYQVSYLPHVHVVAADGTAISRSGVGVPHASEPAHLLLAYNKFHLRQHLAQLSGRVNFQLPAHLN